MSRHLLSCTAFLWVVLGAAGTSGATTISVGAFPDLNHLPPVAIPAGSFLVPVQISGAVGLENWQFDLVFDNTVVEEVDPFDGSSGIYGARFLPGDPGTDAFILGGFPLNVLGRVDDVAGAYPSLLSGPSGDGILAYIVFRFLPGQQGNDPVFTIDEPIVPQPVPEPGTLMLLAGVLAIRRFAPKRHDLGPAFHGRNYYGSMRTQFMTTPLWGVGSTAPYGHDGRSTDLTEVILRHGGEAAAARAAFAELDRSESHAVLAFLRSLVLFPPDDTASNLDPGDPFASGFPQYRHGSTRLTMLFNSPSIVD